MTRCSCGAVYFDKVYVSFIYDMARRDLEVHGWSWRKEADVM